MTDADTHTYYDISIFNNDTSGDMPVSLKFIVLIGGFNLLNYISLLKRNEKIIIKKPCSFKPENYGTSEQEKLRHFWTSQKIRQFWTRFCCCWPLLNIVYFSIFLGKLQQALHNSEEQNNQKMEEGHRGENLQCNV